MSIEKISFIPYVRERDGMGRLVGNQSYNTIEPLSPISPSQRNKQFDMNILKLGDNIDAFNRQQNMDSYRRAKKSISKLEIDDDIIGSELKKRRDEAFTVKLKDASCSNMYINSIIDETGKQSKRVSMFLPNIHINTSKNSNGKIKPIKIQTDGSNDHKDELDKNAKKDTSKKKLDWSQWSVYTKEVITPEIETHILLPQINKSKAQIISSSKTLKDQFVVHYKRKQGIYISYRYQ